MLIPILGALIPTLVNLAEKIIPQSGRGNEKKELVISILSKIYDTFLKGKLPDFEGIDERALFIEVSSMVIDFTVSKVLK